MVNALIGRKVGMTQVYDDEGTLRPVTVIELGPCDVVQVKTAETDGYEAVQLAFGDKKEKRTPGPMKGHFAKAGVGPRRVVREVAAGGGEIPEAGTELKADVFAAGDMVDVLGTTKGRGFAGVVKRWGFSGGPASHGSKTHRRAGSIGPGTDPAHVIKGRRMAGHYGHDRRTVKNLEIVQVDVERNLVLVSGAVPGHKNSIVMVRHATSAPKAYKKAREGK